MKNKNKTFTYKVEKGDYIYSILRSYDLPQKDLQEYVDIIKELNPDIKNINKIQTGKIITLPRNLIKRRTEDNLKLTSVDYIVKKGEYLAKIVRDQFKLPDRLIFDQYLEKFMQLNPDINNPNKLEVGQKINLPLINNVFTKSEHLGKIKKKFKTLSTNNRRSRKNKILKKNKKTPEKYFLDIPKVKKFANKLKQPKDNQINKKHLADSNHKLMLCQTMLEKTGFLFDSGHELLYPLPDKGWLRINLNKMPLARTPWGHKILFVNEKSWSKIPKQVLTIAGIKLCQINSDWDLQQIFEQLERLTDKKLIFWGANNNVLLNKKGYIFELKSDYILITKDKCRKYYLFEINSHYLAAGKKYLRSYLAEKNIYFFPIEKSSGKIQITKTKRPCAEDIYISKLSSNNEPIQLSNPIIESAYDHEKLTKKSPSINTFNSFLEKEIVKLLLYKEKNSYIFLYLYLRKHKDKNKVLLFEPEQANPFLIALLSLKGYTCYRNANL